MTDKPTIVAALSKVMEDVRSVGKGERNSQQGFMFRGIDAVMNAVGPSLRKHGIVIIPEVLEHNLAGSQTSKGNAINVCRVKVQYTAYGPAGDTITGCVPGESMDSGDKATAKAMSVAYRTFLLQALTLPTDETDPDHDVYEAQQPKQKPWDETQADKAIAYAQKQPDPTAALRTAWNEASASGADTAVLTKIQQAASTEPILEGTVQQ